MGDDPLIFREVDDWVGVVSEKWYKSLKKLVKHLTSIIQEEGAYHDRHELFTVRLFFVWVACNIR